jgi:hypothetical protein
LWRVIIKTSNLNVENNREKISFHKAYMRKL